MVAELLTEWPNPQALVATLGAAGLLMDDSTLEANPDGYYALRAVRQLADDLQSSETGPRLVMRDVHLLDAMGNRVQFPVRLISDIESANDGQL